MQPEDAAESAFLACSVCGGVGVLALVAVFIYWRSVGKYVGETWVKVAVELVQVAALAATLGTGFAAVDQKHHWFRPALAAGACVTIWKLLQVLLDNRRTAAEAQGKEEAAEYKRAAETRARLLGVLCESVGRKVGRLRKVIKKRKGNDPRIEHVRWALTPNPHLDDLLNAVCSFFCDQLPESERPVRTFRVGVYIAQNGVMVPVHGVSNRDPGNNPFTSPGTHPNHFRLDAAQPALAVQAARRKNALIIVEDCEKAADAGEFFFFAPTQRHYLKSMVGYSLGSVQLDAATMTSVSLVIDADSPGFFKESDRESLRYCLQEFGVRIKLELHLFVLVEKQGGKHERTTTADDRSREEGDGGEEG